MIAGQLDSLIVSEIFNLSLCSGCIPKSWKSALVLPLLSGDPSAVDNYRPVSRLSVLAKLSLITEQLKHFLADNCVLSSMQSGFRQGHSTITAVSSVITDIITALEKKKSCAALVIDLSKGFDTAHHHFFFFLQRLQNIGFSRTVLTWFFNHLSGRTQCVTIDNCT